MFETVDRESTEKFNQSPHDDVMTLNQFLESIEMGFFNDFDGFAEEILRNGMIISKERFYPSDATENKGKLLRLQEEIGELHVVWYNN